ncbi:hypothetical protein [Halomonas sp. BM-2019]|uniref:hypothetical protein n=1 Tax=Halomonas sp. BM-2019 TaxID=2811227 RepID=UPI001B3C2FF1|nr:MAG: hypothetical protein J5F18_14825 [Halomonas sp. BM-2019]
MTISDAHNLLTSENATADSLMEARALVKSELRALEAEPKVAPGSGTTREQVLAIRQAQAEREEAIGTLTDLHDRLHRAVQQRLAADALEEGERLQGEIAEALVVAEQARAEYRQKVGAVTELAHRLAECRQKAPELSLSHDALRRLVAMEPVPEQQSMTFVRSLRG